MKECNRCKVTKNLELFDNSKHSKDGKYSICKTCKRESYRVWYEENPNKVKVNEENRNKRRRVNVKETMFERVRRRCLRTGVEFSIEIDDIIVPTHCPVFGFKLEPSSKGPAANSPSLDRIDPKLGYIKGNVQVISHLANSMKNNASHDQLVLFAKWILGV
jgi:hypothetical protein